MGAQRFYFILFFFLNLPFTLLCFRLLKNIPGKYRTLTWLLLFFIRKGRISRFMYRCQFNVRFCTLVMVKFHHKCMEKAHSGYTNHHLLLFFSRRGVFSLGNSLHVHILITTGHAFIHLCPPVTQSKRISLTPVEIYGSEYPPRVGVPLQKYCQVIHTRLEYQLARDCYFWHGSG